MDQAGLRTISILGADNSWQWTLPSISADPQQVSEHRGSDLGEREEQEFDFATVQVSFRA